MFTLFAFLFRLIIFVLFFLPFYFAFRLPAAFEEHVEQPQRIQQFDGKSRRDFSKTGYGYPDFVSFLFLSSLIWISIVTEKNLSLLLSAIVLACLVPPYSRYAQGKIQFCYLQILSKDVSEQKFPRMSYVAIPQGSQRKREGRTYGIRRKRK